jgi:hypothetical protein
MTPVSNNVYEIINKGTIIELFSTILTDLNFVKISLAIASEFTLGSLRDQLR